MIQAMIFDLDGTLVQTEALKALSYARAATELCPRKVNEDEVIEAFRQVVGRSRQEVAQTLMERFNLHVKSSARMADFGVSTPWQAFVQVRLGYYRELVADPEVVRGNLCQDNISVLDHVRQQGLAVGLATMSYCEQATSVLRILGMNKAFDFVATRDDVDRGKPDPEIYALVSENLSVLPHQCLVLEDSATGVRAALAAGMHCIAATSSFTRESVHKAGLLDPAWIVDDGSQVVQTVQELIRRHAQA